METTTKLSDFLNSIKIDMNLERAESNPNMADAMPGSRHWRCTFNDADFNIMRVHFTQGPAFQDVPTRDEVMDCLASDAAGYENSNGSFDDWCDEYGYDTDSRKAYATFEAVRAQAEDLKSLLGDESYQTLLWEVERN